MLDANTMRAVGMMVARMARGRAVESGVAANEVIELAPLLEPWRAGSTENPVDYAAGDVRTHAGQPWKCAKAHTHHGEPGWEPGTASSLWANYHATDAAHALPWIAPTGAHDAYQTGEWMIWTDGKPYCCTQNATVWGPDEMPGAWEVGA